MRRLSGLFIIFLGYCNSLSAQTVPDLSLYKTTAEKLQQWEAYCRALLNNDANSRENYQQLINAGQKGLSVCPPDKARYRSLFYYYKGCGFEGAVQYDSAIYNYEQAEAAARKAGSLADEVTAIMRLNYMYYGANRPAMQDSLIRRINAILDTTKDISAKAVLYGSLGEYYQNRSEHEKFIQNKIKAIDFRKQMLDNKTDPANMENIGISYLQIAGTYVKIGQPQKVIEYLGYAKEYTRAYRDGLAFIDNYYIDAYLKLAREDSAAFYFNQLYKMMTAADSLYTNLSYANRCFAEYHLYNKQTEAAYGYSREAYRLAKRSGDEEIMVEANTVMGKVQYDRGDYKSAIDYLKAGSTNAYHFDKDMYAAMNQKLAQSYAALHQWDKAYAYYDIYSRLHDTLLAEAANKILADAEGRFQNKEKQRQIELKNNQLGESRRQMLWLISGILLLAIVALLLIVIYRNKKKAADVLDEKNKALALLNNELEEANKTKAKLFSIISHDLRSPISQVYQFLKLQQLNPKLLSEDQKAQLSNKIQTATGSLLETMEDLLLWSKTQMSEFKTTVQPVKVAAVVTQCRSLLQLNTESKNIRIDQNIPEEAIVATDPYYLQTIIRNLLQNAIKAAPSGSTISIQFQKQTAAVITIANDGETFTHQQFEAALADPENAKTLTGLGLRLVAELTQKIGAAIHFDSGRQSGTAVAVKLPV